jgi:hypothetical protein
MNVRSWKVKRFLFRWELSYLFKRILLITQCIHGWGMSTLLHRTLKVQGRITLPPLSRCQGLKQGLLLHCFPVRIDLACEMNTWETKGFFRWRFLHTWKIPASDEMDKPLYLSHDTMCERRDVLYLLSLWEMSYLLRGILPISQALKVYKHYLWDSCPFHVNGRSTLFYENSQC